MASQTQWTGLSKLGVGDGQGGLACCGPRGRKESDTTERKVLWAALLKEQPQLGANPLCLKSRPRAPHPLPDPRGGGSGPAHLVRASAGADGRVAARRVRAPRGPPAPLWAAGRSAPSHSQGLSSGPAPGATRQVSGMEGRWAAFSHVTQLHRSDCSLSLQLQKLGTLPRSQHLT